MNPRAAVRSVFRRPALARRALVFAVLVAFLVALVPVGATLHLLAHPATGAERVAKPDPHGHHDHGQQTCTTCIAFAACAGAIAGALPLVRAAVARASVVLPAGRSVAVRTSRPYATRAPPPAPSVS